MKKLLSFLLIGTLIVGMLSVAGCGSAGQEDIPAGEPVPTLGELPAGDSAVTVGETDSLILDAGDGYIRLTEKQGGAVYRSALDESVYDVGSLSKIWKGTVRSLIQISYSTSRQSVQILSATPVQAGAACTAYRIRNGVKFVYDFTDIRIALAVCLTVEGNQLICRIPQAEIREYGTAILTAVELMQFFGCAADGDDGYFLYPDGSGALMEFRKVSQKKLSAKSYSWEIYGTDREYLADDAYSLGAGGVFCLPVFGAKIGSSGFAAMITAGDADANINLYTSALAVKLNRICGEFIFRRTYDVFVTNLDGGSEVRSQYTNIDGEIIPGDREIRYFMLSGEAADYSGMAAAVREYMLAAGTLRDAIPADSTMPLGVDFFVGTMTDSLISEYCSMTTFDQCGKILQSLADLGVESFRTTLEGWNQNGYGAAPASYRINGRAGGNGGLKSFVSLARELNADVFLNVNYVDAAADGGRYSVKRDIIRNRSNSPVADASGRRYLLTAATALKWFIKDSRRLPDGIAGAAFEGFGQTLYNDYQSGRTTERTAMAAGWREVLTRSAESLGTAAAYGGNGFLLGSVSRLYDIPYEDSGFTVADTAVPFYQMVVHGSVAYSAQPANLFSDYDTQALKLAEYGYMPYFKLTWERSEKLKNTAQNTLFTSYYASYTERAAALYRRFREELGDTWDAHMVRHEAVGDGVYRTLYDNGTAVYVNYGDAAATVGAVTVPAKDFTAVREVLS